MDSIIFAFAPVPVPMISAVYHHQHFPCILPHSSNRLHRRRGVLFFDPVSVSRRWAALPSGTAGLTNSMPPRDVIYTVGDFMTKKEDLHVVKTTTTVEEALETLVEKRITGFPVIDDDWKLVGVISDYDLLALDSISVFLTVGVTSGGGDVGRRRRRRAKAATLGGGGYTSGRSGFGVVCGGFLGAGQADTNLFPDVDSSWKSFNEIQRLVDKTNGKVVGDLMTPVPLSVREATNLEDAVRLLLDTKYRRLPVVDGDGKLVGIITRGNIVRAALQIKLASERMSGDQN